MSKIFCKIPFDALQMNEILRLLVALVEARKNSEDFGCALSPENRIGAGKSSHIEVRVLCPPQQGILSKQFQFGTLRNIGAGVLQKRDDVIRWMAKEAVLEIDHAHPGNSFALRKPKQIR